MGQKVNPHGMRVGIIKDWDSRWYAEKKDFADMYRFNPENQKIEPHFEIEGDEVRIVTE